MHTYIIQNNFISTVFLHFHNLERPSSGSTTDKFSQPGQ